MSEGYWKERAERLERRLVALEEDMREMADWWGSVAEEVEKSATPGEWQADVARWHEAQIRALLNKNDNQ